MIHIDTEGLRFWAGRLRPIAEMLVPAGVESTAGAGYPELAIALGRFEDQRQATQLMTAREVDALVGSTYSAATRWEHAEQLLAGSVR